MNLQTAVEWASKRRTGVLITLRSDGRAQSSDIAYSVSGQEFIVSVTQDRAKTVNMKRDRRVVLHVTDPGTWSYASFDAEVTLTPTCQAVDDEVADALVAYYSAVSGGPHPDWDQYRRAMVAERRLLAHVDPRSVTGQING
jgi:PPOX class probable F420-dependent enzyme